MNKLLMCRICLVENVRMYVVTDEHLQEIYEKLTDFPFETGDGRPLRACLFCITKLKQCCQLLKKCLDAEKLFDQMVCKDYRPDTSLQYLGQLEFFGGLTTTPVEHISILDGWQDSEDDDEIGTDDDELGIDGDELAVDGDELAVDDNDASDGFASPDKVDIKDEHCDEDIKKIEVKLQNVDKLCDEQEEQLSLGAPVAKKPALSERGANVEDTITSRQRKNQLAGSKVVPETRNHTSKPVTKVKRSSKKSNLQKHIGTPVAKKPALDVRRANLEDTNTTRQMKNQVAGLIVIPTTRNRTSKPITKFEKPTRMKKLQILKDVNEKLYTCDICQRSLRTKRSLESHIRVHTGEKPYKCKQCQRCFRFKSNLKHHIFTHTGEKPYKCDVCQRSFNTSWSLKNHILTHSSNKPYTCNFCQRSFKIKYSLVSHVLIHTGEKPHKCDVCQRSFRLKRNLNIHSRVHTGEKPYECKQCQRSFRHESHLKHHILTHTGEKPFVCDVCQRSFNTKWILKNHMFTHTGEKPYQCVVCQRSFTQKHSLNFHMSQHTGRKPYKCDVCQRSYSSSCVLKRHAQTHTGEKPHKCEVCQRSFSRKANLANHVLIHSVEKQFQCEICAKCFTQSSTLNSHLRVHKKGK
ncbi:hypothetical protein PYW08_012313 [Mythimna loreyi]|uniref:Uncharacterized protein n=1 Tax=Mythimna loreyi TaxID=667449 RepID=A0ACC2Q2L0_9NEOP|nr:hypothetical protein PYW08_012313 [Mythimna loreyi]